MPGRILGPWNPPRNSAGAIDFAAKLQFFQNGTNNPVAVYSDYGLNTSAGVEVTVGVNGLFPTVWTENRVRVKWLNGDGVQVLQVDDVGPSDAGAANDFQRTFGSDGRAQVRGASGVIQWESGDASPDDAGGKARIGGWNGTALDTLHLDVSGAVTAEGDWTFPNTVSFPQEAVFNGYQVGPVLIARGDFAPVTSPSGTVSPSLALPTTYNMFRLVVLDFAEVANSGPLLQTSADNGGSWMTSALYETLYWRPDFNPTTVVTSFGTLLRTITNTGAASVIPDYLDITLQREITTNHLKLRGVMGRYGSSIDHLAETSFTTNATYVGVANRIRLHASANPIKGKYALYAWPGIGVV